jgi:hypothetical protein
MAYPETAYDKAALAAHVRDFPDALLRERAAISMYGSTLSGLR